MGRASFYQAKRNEESFPILFVQILIVAAALGISEKSWLYFGGSVIGLLALFSIPRISRILGALLAGGFGIIGYYFGSSWWGTGGGYVLGGFVFVMCFYGNYFGADHLGDFNAK